MKMLQSRKEIDNKKRRKKMRAASNSQVTNNRCNRVMSKVDTWKTTGT